MNFCVFIYWNYGLAYQSSVKWNGYNSHFFRLLAGVRQGGVLSPFLFAVFIASVVEKIKIVLNQIKACKRDYISSSN